jgi:AI-2 transport protein TqsA
LGVATIAGTPAAPLACAGSQRRSQQEPDMSDKGPKAPLESTPSASAEDKNKDKNKGKGEGKGEAKGAPRADESSDDISMELEVPSSDAVATAAVIEPVEPRPEPKPERSPTEADLDDWWGLFHIHSFVSLTEADRHIERRELVWIKRFLSHAGRPELENSLEQLLANGPQPELHSRLIDEAARRMTTPEKRRFVYNLAQLCKSKGSISDAEYENILDIATRLEFEDTEADSIINSVFSINDTFTAIIGLLALGFMLYFTRTVIVPLVVALFITMIINKVEGLVSRGLRLRGGLRWVNKLAAMIVILGVLFGVVMAAVSSGKDIARRAPYYQAKIGKTLNGLHDWAIARGIPWPENSELSKELEKLPVGKTLSGFFSSLLDFLGDFFLVVIFVGFLVFSSFDYKGILQEMNEKISAYISIKAMISFGTGLCIALVCWAFGVDFPLFWATLGFLLNFIPSVGSIIATVPPVLLAFIQLDSTGLAAAFAVTMVAIQFVLGNVLEPKMMGEKLAVNPVALMLGLIFWGFLWGLPGMFLAAPLMALLKILASYFNFSRSFERLLSA